MNLRIAHVVLASLCLVDSVAWAQGPSSAPVEQPAPARDRLAGTYGFAGGAHEITAKDAAIAKATEDMFFAIKGVARRRLREHTQVQQPVGIGFANGNLVVSAGGTPIARSPETGSHVSYKNADGDTVKLSQRITADGQLVQIFATDEGKRTNTFALSADGRTLLLSVRIDAGKLPKPIRYTLTYRRS